MEVSTNQQNTWIEAPRSLLKLVLGLLKINVRNWFDAETAPSRGAVFSLKNDNSTDKKAYTPIKQVPAKSIPDIKIVSFNRWDYPNLPV